MWKYILLCLAALAYVLSPVDFIPDLALGFGQIDDIVVLVLAFWQAKRAYKMFKKPKASQAEQQSDSAKPEVQAEGHEID